MELQPRGQGDVRIAVRADKLGGPALREGFVSIHRDGQPCGEYKVEVYPEPRAIVAEPMSIYVDTSKAKLTLLSEAPLIVHNLAINVEPQLVRLSIENPVTRLKVGRNEIPVALENKLAGSEAQVTVTTTTSLHLDEPSRVFTSQCTLTRKKPPTITLASGDTTGFDARWNDETVLHLRIRNDGDDELRVDDLELTCESEDVRWDSDFKPVIIPRSQTKVVSLTFTARSGAVEGAVTSKLRFSSNDPRNPTFPIVATIAKPRLYTDFMAVDYGTSYSAAAICENVPRNLQIDDTGHKVDSGVYFAGVDSHSSPPYTWSIGPEARRLGEVRPERYVRAIKTKVGLNKKAKVRLEGTTREVSAEEVAQMAVMELLRRAGKGLERRKSPGTAPCHVAFTAPTRFSLRQRATLRKVFDDAAKARGLLLETSEVIDESLAAGVYYLEQQSLQDQELRERPKYTLLVMDFGGGTTDVTMFEVTHGGGIDGSGVPDRSVRILGSWGDETLGGEALTEMIAQHLGEKLGFGSEPQGSLSRAADAVKIAVSEYLKEAAGKGWVKDLPLAIPADTGAFRKALYYLKHSRDGILPEDDFQKALDEMHSDGILGVSIIREQDSRPSDLQVQVEDIVEYTRTWLADFDNEMEYFMKRVKKRLEDAGESSTSGADMRADRLLLCGQASLLPVVPQKFARFAGKVDYVRDHRGTLILKECVSLGAMLHVELRGRRFRDDRSPCLWRMLGVGEGLRFRELVEWGATARTKFPFTFDNMQDVSTIAPGNGVAIQFTLRENLSLTGSRRMQDYRTYRLELDGPRADSYEGELELTDDGEVEVFVGRGQGRKRMVPIA